MKSLFVASLTLAMAITARAENILDWTDAITPGNANPTPAIHAFDKILLQKIEIPLEDIPEFTESVLDLESYSPAPADDSHFLFPSGKTIIPGTYEQYDLFDYAPAAYPGQIPKY